MFCEFARVQFTIINSPLLISGGFELYFTMASTLVTPGQPITSESGFLRGHGTYFVESQTGASNNVLTASVSGEIERVNRLISVRPARSRYIGEVGDLVVGRISGVESKRWKVDLGGHRDAVLQLSAVVNTMLCYFIAFFCAETSFLPDFARWGTTTPYIRRPITNAKSLPRKRLDLCRSTND